MRLRGPSACAPATGTKGVPQAGLRHYGAGAMISRRLLIGGGGTLLGTRLLCVAASGAEMLREETGYLTAPDRVRLFYRKVGSGPHRVIIPNDVFLADRWAALGKDFTLVFFDLRNRGRSDSVSSPEQLASGIDHDVADIETVRRHFGFERASVIGHSYLGFVAARYAAAHAQRTDRLVLIGTMGPNPGKPYPPADPQVPPPWEGYSQDFMRATQLAMQPEHDNEMGCKAWWLTARAGFLWDQSLASQLSNEFCQFANEWPARMNRHIATYVRPSVLAHPMQAEEIDRITAPTLLVHGARDRNSPLAASRDWLGQLRQALLLVVAEAGHVPWVERPHEVLPAVARFLEGGIPIGAVSKTGRVP